MALPKWITNPFGIPTADSFSESLDSAGFWLKAVVVVAGLFAVALIVDDISDVLE